MICSVLLEKIRSPLTTELKAVLITIYRVSALSSLDVDKYHKQSTFLIKELVTRYTLVIIHGPPTSLKECI